MWSIFWNPEAISDCLDMENKKSLTQSGKAFSFTFQPKNKTCVLSDPKVVLQFHTNK